MAHPGSLNVHELTGARERTGHRPVSPQEGTVLRPGPRTGTIEWKSEAGQGENAAFVLARGAVLVLEGNGTLLVVPSDAMSFSPTRRYRVAEGPTYAHPVPTDLGVLVKDEDGLSLFG